MVFEWRIIVSEKKDWSQIKAKPAARRGRKATGLRSVRQPGCLDKAPGFCFWCQRGAKTPDLQGSWIRATEGFTSVKLIYRTGRLRKIRQALPRKIMNTHGMWVWCLAWPSPAGDPSAATAWSSPRGGIPLARFQFAGGDHDASLARGFQAPSLASFVCRNSAAAIPPNFVTEWGGIAYHGSPPGTSRK